MEAVDRKTALIADDNKMIRMLFTKVLSSLGIEVIGEASDGEEAIEMYFNTTPTLLLLDILMPGKRGTDVLLEIKESFPEARVIMISSINDEEIAEKCFDLGAEGYLQKSASISDIKQMISAVIG